MFFFFFLFSGLIGLDLCVATCASTLLKTSTTSGVMSHAATDMFSHSVRWQPVLSASSSPTPKLSKSTCCTSIPNFPLMYSRQGKGLYPPIVEMRGTSVEGVDFHPLPSLQ